MTAWAEGGTCPGAVLPRPPTVIQPKPGQSSTLQGGKQLALTPAPDLGKRPESSCRLSFYHVRPAGT